MRLAAALLIVAALSGCASLLFIRPLVIDEYVTAKVRVYRNGDKCRIEVITPVETVQTLPTHCWTVPNVTRGTP